MENEEIKLAEKNESIYECIHCDFKCSFLSDWKRHLTTRKHLTSVNGTKMEINGTKFTEKNETNIHKCEYCEKMYKTASGLWKHKTKCVYSNKNDNISENTEEPDSPIVATENGIAIANNTIIDQYTILSILKQNNELQQLLIEQNKTIIELSKNNQVTNTTTHTNSHNKAFNLNFFLNETCKDAMNIMDFVESIKLQVSDLESVGELGYIEGISNIIVKNLNALDVTQRPVHCTDKKRETIYIKDDNKWEKDEEQKKMHKMIKKVADKNARLLPKFTEKYPDYKNYHSKNSDKYSKIIVESMGGSGDNDYEKEEKIIKNITKSILVDKENMITT
jgi:hypothetical protein